MGIVRTKARARGAVSQFLNVDPMDLSAQPAVAAVDAAIKTSIEEERGWIIEVIEKRRELIRDALEKCAEGSREWGIFAIQISELDHMAFMIRARSDS